MYRSEILQWMVLPSIGIINLFILPIFASFSKEGLFVRRVGRRSAGEVVAGLSSRGLSSCQTSELLWESELSPNVLLTLMKMSIKSLHHLFPDRRVQSATWACAFRLVLRSTTQ